MVINYREQYAKYSRYFQDLKQAYEKKPEVRVSVNLLLTLFTISFFALFALRPTLNTISDLLAETRSQQEISTRLDEKITKLREARTNWVKEEKRLFLLDQSLPTDSHPNDYLQQIEALTAKYDLSLNSIHIDEVVLFGKEESDATQAKSQGIKTVKISFSVNGSYPLLASFLTDIENLRRVIKITSISLGQGKGKQIDSIVLTVSGEVPYFPQDKP